MTSTEPATTSEREQVAVPVQRSVPAPEERPRRRHDGSYWDVTACAWLRCPE